MPRFIHGQPTAEGHGPSERIGAGQVGVLGALTTTLAVNLLANALPLHGQTTGEIAAQFSERFRPAGYTFGIWSLIYLGLLVYAVYQALPGQRDNPALRAIELPFYVSCTANVTWLFAWHYGRVSASLCAMFVLLAALVTIDQHLRHGAAPRTEAERWCVEAPFRVYLAWITVATFANFSAWMEARGMIPADLAGDGWAIVLLSALTIIVAFVGWLRKDALFLGVVLWALIGIVVRHGLDSSVSLAAVGAILVTTMLLVRSLLWRHAHGSEPSLQRAGMP
jgi:hypothetical protein